MFIRLTTVVELMYVCHCEITTQFNSVFKMQQNIRLTKPENNHPWGKYHYEAGLQFYKFGFSGFTTNKNNTFSSLVKSSLVKLEISCTVILPPMVSIL